MNKIKDQTKVISEFISSLLNADMSKEDIDKYQSIIDSCKAIDEESDKVDKELHDCKEAIVNVVKNSGSPQKPQEDEVEKEPRTLEEIAKDIVK